MSLRIVFMGSPAFAVPSLAHLAERPDLGTIVGVVCQPDKPAGRGRKLTPPAVKVAATARGIPVFQPTKMKAPETANTLAAWNPDIAVVAAYGRILPKTLLEIPKLGCINVHASILPRHRGASPIQHAILAGDTHTGISIMEMDEGLDTGPVYITRSTPIGEDEYAGELSVHLAELGAKALVEALPKIAQGKLQPTPQDDSQATYAPLLTKSDGMLRFDETATALARRVRAMHPWPGAFVILEGQRVQVLKVEAKPDEHDERQGAGEVVRADATGVWVACATGTLRLLEVKPAGRKAMPTSAWVAGRGVSRGQRFALLP